MNKQVNSQDTMIAEYHDGPNRLESAIAGLSEKDLDIPSSEGGWTIRKIVHHLADGDDIWKAFIKQAIGNPGGEFKLQWYWEIPQDEWVECWDYQKRAIGPSLAMFRANRDHIAQLLEQIPGVWERVLRIRWPNDEEEDVRVRWVIEMQTKHVEGHVKDIARIRESYDI